MSLISPTTVFRSSVHSPDSRSGLHDARGMASYVLMLVLAVCLLSACGPPKRPAEPDNLFWPLPPDPPRIKYLQSIYSEDDIGRVYSFMEQLFGKDYHDSMVRPYGVFARAGTVAVADVTLQRVLLFDLAAKRLTVAGDDGTLRTPSAVVIDSSGRIYVADGPGGKVALYDPSGRYLTAFLMKDSRPIALALNEQAGKLYVIDGGGHRILVFGLDGSPISVIGKAGRGAGEFNFPIDIAIDRSGRLYVLDARNFRVQVLNGDGGYLRSFGSAGDGPGSFANPKGIALDSKGHIYVTDAAYSNFQIFDEAGKLLLFVGSLGPRPGEMHLPAGISIDEQDRIYVADQLNGRVQVFQYLGSD